MQKLKINSLIKFLSVMFVVFSFTASEAQQIFERNYYYNTNYSISPTIIKKVSDGYLVAGSILTATLPNNELRGLVTKFDTLFNTQWNIGIGISQANYVYGFLELPDSSFIISCRYYKPNSTIYNLILTRLDKSGNIMWSRIIDNNVKGVLGGKMIIDNDGSILLFGSIIEVSSLNGIPGIADLLILRFDSTGNVLSTKTLKAGNWLSASNVIKTAHNNYQVMGRYADSIHNYFSVAIMEFDSVVQPVSLKIIRDDTDLFGMENYITNDNCYVFNRENNLIKTDSLLNVHWAKNFYFPINQYQAIYDIFQMDDGSFIFCGSGIQ